MVKRDCTYLWQSRIGWFTTCNVNDVVSDHDVVSRSGIGYLGAVVTFTIGIKSRQGSQPGTLNWERAKDPSLRNHQFKLQWMLFDTK